MAFFDWSTTAADNDDADSAINWAEGQAPSTVNDSARSMMARLKHFLNGISGNTTQGGASNAYTLTSGEALSSYDASMVFMWSPNADSTGAVTLNVDAIGAKKVYMPDGTQAGSGDLDADSAYLVIYDASLDSSSGAFKISGFQDTTLAGGSYLAVSNNLSDVDNAATALGNLGGQPLEATLTGIAGLSPTANQGIYATGADTFSTFSLTAAGRALLDDASASAQRTTLGLGSMALETATDYAELAGADFTGLVRIDGGNTSGPLQITQTTETDDLPIAWFEAANGRAVTLRQPTPYNSSTAPFVFSTANAWDFVVDGVSALLLDSGGNTVVGGELTARVATGSVTTGALTAAGNANKQTDLTGNPSIAGSVFSAGDILVLYAGSAARTITQGAGMTMRLDGTTTTGSRTLAARGTAGVRFVSATECVVSGGAVT